MLNNNNLILLDFDGTIMKTDAFNWECYNIVLNKYQLEISFADFLDCVDAWDTDEKIKIILAVGECGYSFTFGQDAPDQFGLDLYEMDSLRDLAMEFVEQGLFGDIPANIQNYLDYNAIAYDLGMDYSETTIDGTHYIYRMA